MTLATQDIPAPAASRSVRAARSRRLHSIRTSPVPSCRIRGFGL